MKLDALALRYARYVRACAGWNVRAQSFEDYKAYWEVFCPVSDAEESVKSAPILVHRV